MRKQKFNRGSWAVQRERLQIEASSPPPPFREAVPIGNVLQRLVARFEVVREDPVIRLAGEWPAIVGEDVAAHTRPARLQDGKLEVFVDNSVWLGELARHGRARMIQNIRERLGDRAVRDIQLRIDPDPRPRV